MDPDHALDTLFGGVVESGNQLVNTVDKVGDILCHVALPDGLFHARSQRQLPILLQRFQLYFLAVTTRGVLQLRAKYGSGHIVKQLLIVGRQRNSRQQAVTLHTQRACLVNGVGAALHSMHQAGGYRHTGHANNGGEQYD